MDIEELILDMTEQDASDLHLSADLEPTLRVDGSMVKTGQPKLSPDECQKLVYSLLTDTQKQKFESTNELDLSFQLKSVGRIRMNVSRQKGCVSADLRLVPGQCLPFESLGLPAATYNLMNLQKGLILVTGSTGTGKSTTLASMVDHLNTHREGHIVTIEDPIEFVHTHKRCVVKQREVGSDTHSFAQALKYVLRQDPDVILIGEMRDLETIQAALTIAETGHLVLASLHTSDAAQSINRIVDVFPVDHQAQVRSQLSFVLQAVISQTLVGRATGIGRILACEVLIGTPAVRNLIREGKVEHLPAVIQTSAKVGMQTLNQSLVQLYKKNLITYQQAVENSPNADELTKMLPRA